MLWLHLSSLVRESTHSDVCVFYTLLLLHTRAFGLFVYKYNFIMCTQTRRVINSDVDVNVSLEILNYV